MTQDTIQQTFTVSAPANVKVSNVRGSVLISQGEAGVVTATAVKHTNSGNARHTDILMTQAGDGSVTIETRLKESFRPFFSLSNPCKVDYNVRIPAGSVLEVSCVSSSTAIENLEGDISLSTVSGSIELQKLSGPLKISAVSGDISGTGLSGVLRLKTVSGDVKLSDSNLPQADVTTVSGDVTLQTPLAEGPYHFNSVSGDIHLLVPAEAQCTVEFTSISGNINLPSAASHPRGSKQVIEVQGGGAQVQLRSVSGDLWVGQLGSEAMAESTTPPVPPKPPAPLSPEPPAEPQPAPLSRAEILERIERGEMSVEEGIKHLQNE